MENQKNYCCNSFKYVIIEISIYTSLILFIVFVFLLLFVQENDVFTWKVKKLAKGGEQPKPSSSGSRVLRNKVKPPNKLM